MTFGRRLEQRSRALVAATAAFAVVSGCIAPKTTFPSARPTVASDVPTASAIADLSSAPSTGAASVDPPATPAPTLPPDPLQTTATVEGDGVRLTIELERNPMPAGQETWITSTVTNTGTDPVVYVPCGEAVFVGATSVGPAWRRGRALPRPANDWKAYLLNNYGLEHADRSLLFFAEGETGASSGCGDVARSKSLAPGATFRDRARWDGFAYRRLAPPPTARIDVVAKFEFDRGDPLAEHPPEETHVLEAHLEAWISGLRDAFLDPAEAVDIALAEPRLTALLATRDLRNGNEGVVIFDPKTGLYQIGMLESGNLPVSRVHLVLVNARTGEIAGYVERDWDYDVDGYP